MPSSAGLRTSAQWVLCALTVLAVNAQTFTGQHYELELRPDFEARVLDGKARIHLLAATGQDATGQAATGQADTAPASTLELLSPRLHIRHARLEGEDLPLEKTAGGWRVPLNAKQAQAAAFWLEIDYRASAGPGLEFGKHYVMTAFHTCRWMPCVGSDLSRASVAMSLDLPAGYRSVASGQRLAETSPGRPLWRQNQAYPLYTLGFAAGRFTELMDSVNPQLRYLGVNQDQAALAKKFKDSARMLDFFEDKAGMPLPHPIYTQVLVPGGAAQEASSFSLIGTRMLDPILEDPQEDWVIAHEMAHQWWGNLITCATWDELWLNEGVTVFMTAAWKQHRWGDAAYQRELVLLRQRWQDAKDIGFDKPLSWTGEYPSLKIKRAIHYSKGALFLNTLRDELGEQTFWDGLRRYSREHAGRSVVAGDLQAAMEKSAGRSLQALFDAWVY